MAEGRIKIMADVNKENTLMGTSKTFPSHASGNDAIDFEVSS